MATPDHILLKPGRLTPEERLIVQEHAEKGRVILEHAAKMIDGESYLSFGAQIAGAHHECYDGSGYPNGLKGTAIPLAARIVAVVDVFDALVHQRPYKQAWPLADALDYLREFSGSEFDPLIVEAFLAVIRDEPDVWQEGD